MPKALALAAAIAAFSAVGCSSVTHALDRLSDDELAKFLETSAQKTTQAGIQFALKKNPDKAAQIQKDGLAADQVIRGPILTALSGSSGGTVLKSAFDVAMSQLSSKLSGTTLDNLILVANIAEAQLPLPVTGALSPRLQKALVGFFTGMAEGLEAALKIPGPTPPPAPPPAPPPPPPK
jgi:hypothetical protein